MRILTFQLLTMVSLVRGFVTGGRSVSSQRRINHLPVFGLVRKRIVTLPSFESVTRTTDYTKITKVSSLTALLRDEEDEEDEYEYARIRRGRNQDDKEQNEEDVNNSYYDNSDETDRNQKQSDNPYYREENNSWDFIDELDEQWEGDYEPMEKYDLLGNVLIPNPILDNIDPDGAAERFPELARDPRFWFDIFLFVAFLDFLSMVGPRDFFPDLPLPFVPL